MKKISAITLGVITAMTITASNFTLAYHSTYTNYSKIYNQLDTLIDKGKYKEVVLISKKLLNANSTDVKARTFLGIAYSSQYKLDAAYDELQRVLEYDPDNSDAHNGLGSVYYRRTTSSDMQIRNNIDHYYEMALNEFIAAIKLNPENYRAYNNAGRIYQEKGQLQKAEDFYTKGLEVKPNYSKLVTNYGTVFFAKGEIDKAIEQYNKALSLNSKNSSAYYHLGEAYIAKGEYSKAIEKFNTSLYLFNNSAPVHNMLGRSYELQGNETAAIKEYNKANFIKPEFTPPYLNLANIFINRGDNELAISELKKAIAMNPDFIVAKLKIADISYTTSNNEQAIKYYKEVLNDPQYASYAAKGISRAYFRKAQDVTKLSTNMTDDNYNKAKDAIQEAIKYNPDDIELYLALLRLSRLSNDDKTAQQYLSKIINNSENGPIASIIRGEAYLTYKKYLEADSEFKKAISLVDDNKKLIYLGEIFIMNRQYTIANETFLKVLATDPDNKQAGAGLEKIDKLKKQAKEKYKVARYYFKEDQKGRALEELRQSIALNPNNKEAQLLLAGIFEKQKYLFNAVEHYTAYLNLIIPYSATYYKYDNKIKKLNKKLKKQLNKGKTIKKYTRI